MREDMATHSSILAWRIPWTEEPGGLQSIGMQRVRHNWSDSAHRHSWDVHSSYWVFSLLGSLCVDYGPNSKQNFHCHSKHLSPFGFIFLKLSGEPNIKTPHILESLCLSFTEGAKLSFFFFSPSFFLCRYEKDMALPVVIFALWERIWNNNWNANRLPMTRALWKPLPMYWFVPERDPVGLSAASPVQTQPGLQTPRQRQEHSEISAANGTHHPAQQPGAL